MEYQSQFSFKRAPIEGQRTEPRLWVKGFAFYADYKPDQLVRHLTLRRGLNIIWAKDSATGASGHAAGKSTFCRLLRYLIGDTHFGTETFRPALRQKFPDAILAGEVVLNGTPWLICRPLSLHGRHWCAPGHRFEELFDEGFSKQDYSHFTEALHQAFVAPLGIPAYPGSERKPEWQHLLQWLSRDQDARYADPLLWRAGSESGVPLDHEKTNLIRLLLGHLGRGELLKQQAHAKALKDRNDLKTLLPKLQFARDREVNALKKRFPELKGKNVEFESKLEELQLRLGRWKNALITARDQANQHDGVGEVLVAKVDLTREKKATIQRRVDAQADEIKRRRIQLAYRNKQLTREEYKRQLATLGDIEGKCSAMIELAHEVNCPLAPPLDRDELQLAKLQQVSDSATQLENFINTLVPQLDRLRAELKNATKEFDKVNGVAETKRKKHAARRTWIFNRLEGLNTTLQSIGNALSDTVKIREGREQQKKLDDQIDASSDELARIRKKAGKLISTLSDDFSGVASHLTETEIHGAVSFHSDAVVTSFDYDGDMSSAALVTLKLLTFDLACLVGSVRADNHHPGFLLHDSPREADLSAGIYRRIFTLIAGEEENEAVQYVIATTEAPPEGLQGEPWLVCEPLSSEQPATRFLKTIV